MNTLEQIHEMWKKDCLIDKIDLDKSARDSAKLHSKYLDLYSVAKIKQKDLELKFKVILRDKFKHYNGKLSKEEIDDLGWTYDPMNGLTVLKGDMDKFYDSDPMIQDHQAKIQYAQEIVDTLKEILENIKWRHQNIKNIIEWNKFTSGI